MRPTLRQTLALVRSDMQFRCDYENKRLSALQVAKFLMNTSALSCALHRFQVFFHRHHLLPLAALLGGVNKVLFTVHIDPSSEIGPGLLLMHANYICIGPNVRIGANCLLAHQNTIAPSPFYTGSGTNSRRGPTIGNRVSLGGGACVVGDITLGDDVQVSMNAAVDASFPDKAVLFGVPAKNVARSAPAETHEIAAQVKSA